MGKIIYSKYDKKLIGELPRVAFPGKITVVISETEAVKAVDYLLAQPVLGVDTETRPSFSKGRHYEVSLLQVSDNQNCFLFRLNFLGISDSIVRLLEDTSVPKIGLSWHDDLIMLKRKGRDFKPGYFIDIQNEVKEIGILDLGLQKIYANLFGMKISKREQLTNWERDILTDKQKMYAATDAWTCINIHEELERLKKTNDFELIIVEEEEKSEAATTISDGEKPDISNDSSRNVRQEKNLKGRNTRQTKSRKTLSQKKSPKRAKQNNAVTDNDSRKITLKDDEL